MPKFILLCVFAVFTVLPNFISGFHTQLNNLESLTDVEVNIIPRTNHFFEKRQQSPNTELSPKRIEFDDHLRIAINAYNQTIHLHLEPNLDLFHPEAAIVVDQQKAQRIHDQPYYERPLVYKGAARTEQSNRDLGWARIIVRNDLMTSQQHPIIEGAFQFNNEIFHIKATSNYNLVKRSMDVEATHSEKMVIYRDSDTTPLTKRDQQQHMCGFDNLMHSRPSVSNPTMTSLFKRSEVFFSQNKHSGCPTTRKINYMGAAADCTYVKYYKNVNNARIQIINNFNMASALFENTFNVSLGLINMTIMDTSCPNKIDPELAWNRACDATYALNDRLSDFSLWRSKMKNDGAGLWHLMTNCPTGVEVGLAWLKQLCNSGAEVQISNDGKQQYVSGAGVSAITREEWKVVAHEIGHGFGAIHDCSASDCPCDGPDCLCCKSEEGQCQTTGYMMSAVSNSSAQSFSPCSIRTICNSFPEIGKCLTDIGEEHHSTYQLNSCGNGVKEEGEECDTAGEDTPCCDAKTCKFKKDAVCEDKTDGCCNNCQLRPKTHMCRPAATPCDLPEFCTGDSSICPTDKYLRDGLTCGLDGLKCASGQCTSRNEQCLSRGFVMNITQSCQTNNEECKLLCNSPDSNKCLIFSGNFVDGTPCGFGGRCQDGMCRNGGVIGSSILYLREHLHVAVPISLVVFMMATAIGYLLFCYGCGRCLGYKERQRRREYYSSELQGTSPNFFEKRSISILSRFSFSTLVSKEKNSIDIDIPSDMLESAISHSTASSPLLSASVLVDEKLNKSHKNE